MWGLSPTPEGSPARRDGKGAPGLGGRNGEGCREPPRKDPENETPACDLASFTTTRTPDGTPPLPRTPRGPPRPPGSRGRAPQKSREKHGDERSRRRRGGRGRGRSLRSSRRANGSKNSGRRGDGGSGLK